MYLSCKAAKDTKTHADYFTGWLPPMLDHRDYTSGTPVVTEMSKALKVPPGKTLKALPATEDLRQWCSAVEDQKDLGSCTAHAGVGIVEYFENRAFGKHIEGSRLFVYKTTRNLMGVKGDTGAWLRTTMAALAHCGVPNERYWQYTTRKTPGPGQERTFDDEPPCFIYSIADNYEALVYFCHDPLNLGVPRNDILKSVKALIAAGIPSMFGFWGFESFGHSDTPGGIPIPCPGEQPQWGHAIAAVGYDDSKKITNTKCNKFSKGALLIRNSWGTGWGDNGYGWLPYQYILDGNALDFWSLLWMKWLDTKNFGLQ